MLPVGFTLPVAPVPVQPVRSVTNDPNPAAATAAAMGEVEDSPEQEDAPQRRVNAASQAQDAENGLTEEDLRLVQELQQRDREVRAHEMAHVAAGGALVVRGAQFEYELGPDGQRYAVGGDVLIDTSPGRTPQETLVKAQRIVATALAPADPSPQDYKVAAEANLMAAQARVEIAREAQEARETSSIPAGDDEDQVVMGAGSIGAGAGSAFANPAAAVPSSQQSPDNVGFFAAAATQMYRTLEQMTPALDMRLSLFA